MQLTTDGNKLYLSAVEDAFGMDVDYAMLVKLYGQAEDGERTYSPAVCLGTRKTGIMGRPDPRPHRHVDGGAPQNLTMRMSMRRFTRLNGAFSKKVENLEAAWPSTSSLQFCPRPPDAPRDPGHGSRHRLDAGRDRGPER